jgi:hypothetical protein
MSTPQRKSATVPKNATLISALSFLLSERIRLRSLLAHVQRDRVMLLKSIARLTNGRHPPRGKAPVASGRAKQVQATKQAEVSAGHGQQSLLDELVDADEDAAEQLEPRATKSPRHANDVAIERKLREIEAKCARMRDTWSHSSA